MLVFYFFAGVLILLGALSLRNGFKFAAYLRRELAAKPPDYHPFVSVIAPCRGLEDGLSENLLALFKQDYPDYEIIFVTDSATDPSISVVRNLIKAEGERVKPVARILIAGEAVNSGQKVHNLKTAVSQVDSRCEVLVFVDSDARPHSGWLKALVAPLADTTLGATTGYRWFVTEGGNFASHLRSVWNASIASALGANRNKNFCWGGSTAIRQPTFESLRIEDAWSGTVSDDFAMSRVLQAAKSPIHFVPQCLVPSLNQCSMRELLEFSNRQLKITRVYAPHLWKPLLIGSLLFSAVFFGGIVIVVVRAALGLSYALALSMLAVIFALGVMKSYIRWKAVNEALGTVEHSSALSLMAHLVLWPIASALFLWNTVTAGFSRRINWRGITYELKSGTEAVIIARE